MQRGIVLVVDDEIHVLQILNYKLKRGGYKVLGATSGAEALGLCRKECPDIIILDIMMPEMDGWEVLSKLKADAATKDIPVFLLTAKAQRADLMKGLAQGVDHYIIKPFVPQQILDLIDQRLGFGSPLLEEQKTP
jgi:two-component system alkaline phosphatase synthesis response regulator PhoP